MGFESIGGECVATCEWNKYARETYAANFKTADHPFFWNIKETKAEDFPAHDVLLAGFPCQPFSIAGVSKKNALGVPHGFKCADQGNLFFDLVRIIEHHRPAAFLLENVKKVAGKSLRCFQAGIEVVNEVGLRDVKEDKARISAVRVDDAVLDVILSDDMACTIVTRKAKE